MKVLLFEWLSGGGLWRENLPIDLDCPMQTQGRQMLNAVWEDFIAGGLEVVVPVDSRLMALFPDTQTATKIAVAETADLSVLLGELSVDCDRALLIAPETDKTLAKCLGWVDPAKWLGPGLEFVELTSNKLRLAEWLDGGGFSQHAQPRTVKDVQAFLHRDGWEAWQTSPKFVLKPIDGAGSEGVRMLERDNLSDLAQIVTDNQRWILEPFHAGLPVSISVICGESEPWVLPPTLQVFDKSPIGHFVGSQFPVGDSIEQRAKRLARDVLQHLPKTRGYLGMDLVIDPQGEPDDDRLIEINPRITMSYLKLREIVEFNLAQTMVQRGS